MIRTLTNAAIAVGIAVFLTSCGNSSPGPLGGTWQATGIMPMTVTFRNGETETMGVIEKVDYKVEAQSVIVTYKDGLMKGTAVRFGLVAPTHIQAMGMSYRKVGN